MKTKWILGMLFGLCCVSANAQDWVQFRGPNGLSSAAATLPATLDDNTIAWETDLPGRGVSGPIVVGNRVFVTASSGKQERELHTLCFDRETGKQIWAQQLWATGRCLFHPTSANAAPTPASDGERVYSFFSSNDLACYDLDGNLVWFRGLAVDHPKAGNDVGMSSSPVVHNGIVVAQVEGHADSFVIGVNAKTGETLWEVKRPNKASWASPLLLIGEDKKPLVAIQSAGLLSLLELETGKSIFETKGSVGTIASAAVADGQLFVPLDGTTAYRISDKGLEKVWNEARIQTSTSSGIVHQDKLYSLSRNGILKSFDLKSGQPVSTIRVGGSYWSTPVVGGSRMYFFAMDGTARVVDLEKMEVVNQRKFEDQEFLGSPAISDNALFVRSNSRLYKFAEKP